MIGRRQIVYLMVVGVVAACASTSTAGLSPTGVATTTSTMPGDASCHLHGPRPDPTCTPGALDPRVMAATIHETICVPGWSERVRPPESVTEPIKRQRMRAYGVALPLRSVELDHLIPIELGGATTVPNLWPEPLDGPQGALAKDRLENDLHALVCEGRLALADAQRAIATDWVAAAATYGPPAGA